MQIEVVDHVAGAARARGIALVSDVFRAFTVAPHAVAAGAHRDLTSERDFVPASREELPALERQQARRERAESDPCWVAYVVAVK